MDNITIESPYKPRPLQEKLHLSKKRYRFCVAHRRFGKSACCVAEVIHKASTLKPKVINGQKRDFKMNPPRYHFVAPTKDMAMKLGFDTMDKFLGDYPHYLHKADQKITFPHQKYNSILCTVYFVGAQKIDFQRGQYSDGIVVDEYSEMPSIWKPAVIPLTADFSGWAFFIGTPKGRGPFYRLMNEAMGDSKWDVFNFKASETGHLSDDELAAQREMLGEEMYRQEYECDFNAQVEGAVYNKIIGQLEEASRVGDIPHNPNLPVWTAWDLGSAAPCVVWFAQIDPDNNCIRFIDFFEKREHGINRSIMDIQTRMGSSGSHYVYARHILPWDAHSRTDMVNRSPNIKPFRDAIKAGTLTGQVKVISKASQQEGITAVQSLLPKCYFDRSRCNDGLDKLSMYRFEKDNTKDTFKKTAIQDWSAHAADAMRTFAMGMPSRIGAYAKRGVDYKDQDIGSMPLKELMENYCPGRDRNYFSPGIIGRRQRYHG